MTLCVPISPTSSTSSYSSAASPQISPSSSPPSSSSSPSSAFETMTLPVSKQVPSTAPSSPYSPRGPLTYLSGSRSALDLHHPENGSTTTLHRNYVDSSHKSDTPRASQFTARSPSPSQRFSSLSINDSIGSQDFRMSTLSTLTISQYQTCHPYFWFSDGSIVLSVQSTLFKVHRSTLATHSEMFADMFDMGTLTDVQSRGAQDQDEWFDGCRVVKLFDDSSDDWVDLLGAIYKPNHFDDVPSRQFQIRHSSSGSSLPNDTSTSPQKPFNLSVALDFTAGILRLSHKYLIPHLRGRCLALLAPFFPTTFEDFTISMPLLNPQFFSSPASQSTSSPPKKRDRDSGPLMTRSSTILRAINLFHAVDIPHFLPYAYYCLSKLPTKRILHTRELDPAEPPRAELSWREKAMIIHGKEQLRLAAMKDTMAFLGGFRRAVGCTSEYEDDADGGGIHSPMYSHHVALKECDYAARCAWDDILRGDFSADGCSRTVRSGGGTTAAANAAWASTASLITLNLNVASHASAYTSPPVASTASTGSTGSSTGAMNVLNFPSSPAESINLTDPFAPFLSWDLLGPHVSSHYTTSSPYSSSSSSSYMTPHHSYASLAQPSYASPYPSTAYSSPYTTSYPQTSTGYSSTHHPTPRAPAMCPACLNQCQIQHYDARRRVWEALPEVFGLGTWDEVRRRGANGV